MSFHTERPKTTQEKISELLEKRNVRKENIAGLLENLRTEREIIKMESLMEATQIEQRQKDAVTESLNQRREKRTQQRVVQETTLNRLSLVNKVKETVMNKVLFEMVYDAYWLDSDIKKSTIQETYNSYRDLMGVVESTCSKSKTPDANKTKFVKAMEEIVQEMCEKVADRVITEAREKGDPDIDFNFTEEEESELDRKMSELGRDEIVDLVKNKVMTVVQDERESGKEKAEMMKEIENSLSEDEPSYDNASDEPSSNGTEEGSTEPVGESAALTYALAAAILGVVIVGVTLSAKDKIELKKSLKVYEEKCDPVIKMSQVHATMYELGKDNSATNKELSGVKKFFNKNSKRAKVWKTNDGKVVCTAIVYTTTDVSPGVGISSNGVSPSMTVTTTYNYSYHVEPKYMKDNLYLSAMMAYEDNFSNKNTKAFVLSMKKNFPEEVKNTKVKLIGKSLESVEADPENTQGKDIDIIIQGENEPAIMESIGENFIERDSASKLMNGCGASCAEADATYMSAISETDPEKAIELFHDYEGILNRSKLNVMIAPSTEYSHEVKSAVSEAIDKHIKMCQESICAKKKEIQESCNRPKATLESKLLEAKKRALVKSNGRTLFESMMMANAKTVRESAVTEGLNIKPEDTLNAALIESVLQYTVLETLNTLKLYNFSSADVNALRMRNKSSLRK